MEERANGPSIFGGCPTPFFYSHTMAPWKIVVGIPGCGCKAVHGTAQSAAGRRALGLSLSAASDRALGLPRGSPRGLRVKFSSICFCILVPLLRETLAHRCKKNSPSQGFTKGVLLFFYIL